MTWKEDNANNETEQDIIRIVDNISVSQTQAKAREFLKKTT